MRIRLAVFAAVAGAALIGLAGCGQQDAAAGAAPATSTAQPSAAVPSTPGTAASATQVSTSDGCPVSAATLQKAAGLPAGYTIDASSIACKDGWAIARTIAADPAKQGDGETYFQYDTATHHWRKKGEGSALDCASTGIPASTGFCYSGK